MNIVSQSVSQSLSQLAQNLRECEVVDSSFLIDSSSFSSRSRACISYISLTYFSSSKRCSRLFK